jgi:hypothetical protein
VTEVTDPPQAQISTEEQKKYKKPRPKAPNSLTTYYAERDMVKCLIKNSKEPKTPFSQNINDDGSYKVLDLNVQEDTLVESSVWPQFRTYDRKILSNYPDCNG